MSSGDLDNMVLNIIERWWAGRYSEKHGLVTSYDPKLHLAKVMFQPQGQESGWVPIETGHIGAGYGIVTGLQPGDGKQTGDQVIVRFQEGDVEAGKIVQRVHSDSDKPPEVQSGKSDGGQNSAQGAQGGTGQQIYFKNDGSLTLTDGNGATIMLDGNGNVNIQCKKLQIDASDVITMIGQKDIGIQAGGNTEINSSSITGIDGGSKVVVQGGGSVSDGSVTPPHDNPVVPKFEVPA
jgi:phage baseplate assembly protein gpV